MTVSTAPLAPSLPASRAATPSLRRSPLGWWAAGFAAWTLVAALSILQGVMAMQAAGRTIEWPELVISRLADWYTCAVFTPAFFWMVRRFPAVRRDWVRPALIYVALTMAIVVGKFALHLPVLRAMSEPGDTQPTLARLLARGFITENVAFWCVLAIVLAIEYYRRLGEREVQAAQLGAELANARLDALTAQLHPHFLFNTLQGVSTLLYRDPAAADAVLARLSELLRRTLRDGRGHEVTLAEELDLLELYLSIMRTRFSDRLSVGISVPPDLREALVPRFVLQPLVENALQHGIGRRAGSGRVEVAAVREGDSLVLRVADDGPGDDASGAPSREGVGLSNTRRRLAQLYGDERALELGPGSLGGLCAAVRIPWHTSPRVEAVPA